MSSPMNRRDFLRNATLATAGFWLASQERGFARTMSPNEKLNVAVVGVAHQGAYNLDNVRSESIVALCDVDDTLLAAAAQTCPGAKTYNDFRKMLEQKDIDAVVIATPDHVHAPATMAALDSGRPVYCEKPLTHTVWEARQVAEKAKKTGLATQMGTQIHATSNYRRVVEVLQSGAIGPVREVHMAVSRDWGRPAQTPANESAPANLHWDLWLGPAAAIPYRPDLHPAEWRRWWDFGGGTLGDMGCHYIDLAHWALGLRHPISVEAEGAPADKDGAPNSLTVRYHYPARGAQPPVVLTWYSNGRPPAFDEPKLAGWNDAMLFIGDKGMLKATYGNYTLYPEKDFEGYTPPAPSIPESIGHHAEWIKACKTGSPTLCNFDYAGALSEAVLLGNVAYRAGTKIEWDPKALRITNSADANRFLRRSYRKGWTL